MGCTLNLGRWGCVAGLLEFRSRGAPGDLRALCVQGQPFLAV